MRHFFDLSDVRDVERADEFAERTQVRRRRADTYGERKSWRDALREPYKAVFSPPCPNCGSYDHSLCDKAVR